VLRRAPVNQGNPEAPEAAALDKLERLVIAVADDAAHALWPVVAQRDERAGRHRFAYVRLAVAVQFVMVEERGAGQAVFHVHFLRHRFLVAALRLGEVPRETHLGRPRSSKTWCAPLPFSGWRHHGILMTRIRPLSIHWL
jgi:hypothetical protein